MRTAIIGATGYGGAELIRILHTHPYIHQYSLYSSSQSDAKISNSYPHLNKISQLYLQDLNLEKIIDESDIVMMATPSGISSELTPELVKGGVKIIDLSGDFRFKDPNVYEYWYKKKAVEKEVLNKAIYGLPELNRKEIERATIIANPGCYPTATILGLYPLLQNLEIDYDSIIIDAKSGVSGAGRQASLGTNYCEVNENLRIYKVNSHQHIPEIEQQLKGINNKIKPIKFNAHLIPMTRGIMATMYCKPLKEITENALRELFVDHYKNDQFVRIRNKGEYPATKEVYGSNYCDIGITYDERTGWITIVSVIDNLMKGASGQAVQNLNILLGIDEGTGLSMSPIFP